MEQAQSIDTLQEIHDLLLQGKDEDVVALLSEMPTVEVSEFLSELKEETELRLFKLFTPENQGYILASHEPDHQIEILSFLSPKEIARLFVFIQSDDRADLYQQMEQDEQLRLLPYLNKVVRENVLHLSSYPEDSAGGIMSSEFASVTINMTVSEAMDQVRRDAPKKETIYYIYVVDEDRKLMGFISLKDLILAEPEEIIDQIYHEEIVSVEALDDQETVAEKISKYDLIAIPVVNPEDQLIGIITHDDAIDIIREEETEDLQKMGGMEALEEPYMSISLVEMLKKRAGWLMVLLLGGSLTATAMSYFQHEIASVVALTLFIPLIIASGGNSGSQASTLIIRALALNEITIEDWWQIVKKEILTGFLLGLILGILGFLRVFLWAYTEATSSDNWVSIGLTVSFSLIGTVMWGSIMGSILPLILKRLGLDPAVSSAPFVSTVVDVTGLVIYFSIAILFLRGLMV